MARMPKVPGAKKLLRGADALVGGFTVGEKAWEGDRWQAAGLAAAILVPLLWKKRLGALALAAGAAVLSYYFADMLHEREVVTVPVDIPAHPSMN